MIVSPYNVLVPGFPVPNKCLIYNTLSQAIVSLPNEVGEGLVKGMSCPLEVSQEDVNVLLTHGILHRVDPQVPRLLDQIYDGPQVKAFEVTVLTTFNCNFACPYCFEGKRKQVSTYMDRGVADDLIRWLRDWVTQRGYEKVFVVFYGGEPLLNKEIVDYLMRGLRRDLPAKVYFCLITNGSLLEEDLILKWQSLGLIEVRVTLDGPREVHDKRRPFKNGRGSFSEIVGNISRVIDTGLVAITVNFDDQTIERVPDLLKFLVSLGWQEKVRHLLMGPIIPDVQGVGIDRGSEVFDLLFVPDGLFDRALDLFVLARKMGFPVRLPLGLNTCPLMTKDGSVVVDPQGSLYKCVSFVGIDDFSVGTVKEGWNERMEEFSRLRPWKSCPADCKYLPICQGGCRVFAYLEGKDLTRPFCRKEFFDRHLPELIKVNYLCTTG